MTKSEVLKSLAEDLNLTQSETEHIYNSLVDQLTHLLSDDKAFTLPGLGSFSSQVRPSHTSFNPHYRKQMIIPDKKVVRFSQSSVIRKKINGGNDE